MKLTKAESSVDASIANNFSKAIGFIGTFGLIGFIFLIRVMLEKDISHSALVAISFLYLGTVFGICTMLLKQITSIKTESPRPEFQSEYMPPQINSANTNQLEEPKQAPASVVENTTRTLGKVPVERN
jgi:hypothetical protein